MKKAVFIDPFKKSFLSGSRANYSAFFFPAPGCKPRPPAWVESVLTTRPHCPPFIHTMKGRGGSLNPK